MFLRMSLRMPEANWLSGGVTNQGVTYTDAFDRGAARLIAEGGRDFQFARIRTDGIIVISARRRGGSISYGR